VDCRDAANATQEGAKVRGIPHHICAQNMGVALDTERLSKSPRSPAFADHHQFLNNAWEKRSNLGGANATNKCDQVSGGQ
jgi:hypothetical protein